MPIHLDEAKEALLMGAEFGSIYSGVRVEDRGYLKQWFTRNGFVPNLKIRNKLKGKEQQESCIKCGSFQLIITGTCKTCQECGESQGCG